MKGPKTLQIKSTFNPHPESRRVPSKGTVPNTGSLAGSKGGGRNVTSGKGK